MTRALAAFVFVLFAIFATTDTSGQALTSQMNPWQETLPTILAEELSNADANRRTTAMVQVIHYGRLDDGTISWSPVVEPLLSIFENDANDQNRQIAVAALHAIEDPTGMSHLRRLAHKQTSPRVIRCAVDAIVDYYGLESFHGDQQMARLAERGRVVETFGPTTAQADPAEKP